MARSTSCAQRPDSWVVFKTRLQRQVPFTKLMWRQRLPETTSYALTEPMLTAASSTKQMQSVMAFLTKRLITISPHI